ncbi:MAG: 1,4-alpha-glucan branching protein GlgB [Lachnospiraceae bacterium]|nr:1,4-alpha-glucan branching protein GlgB [Lachnospiraceae bacterium]
MQEIKGRLTDMDCYLFGNGTHYEIYRKMGAHPMTEDGQAGTYFAVWAPHAREVSVVGDFCSWQPGQHPMAPVGSSGIWDLFLPGVGVGDRYKFAIVSAGGETLFKADPFASHAEVRPETASVVADLSDYTWSDGEWLDRRRHANPVREAMSVYEVHLGSWMRHPTGRMHTYREIAKLLADYVIEMGYTHVELIGIAEHPYDGSWGYQVTGYYAPTSRYGTPLDFKYFVDYMHGRGIGVILDWVPAHFPRDAHGLAKFDGEPVFEYADPRKGEHPDWGTLVFDYGRNEVSNFLIANGLYWVEEFHVDGLRVDAVASMLYLDYGRSAGGWVPNIYGGNENLEAIQFFRHLNSILRQRDPGAITIAEESTAWPGVTKLPEEDGLGFTFKWNMGWMHDFLEYMKLDPYFRKFNHNRMTFGMTYAWSENYILVLSHDEVVHLKCSMLGKMPGLGVDRYRNLKAGYTFFMGHPGKKLLFMGQEFGQPTEWNEQREIDWPVLAEPFHREVRDYYRALQHLYRSHPAMWATDQDPNGFEWINCDDADRSIFSFMRKDKKEGLLFVINFTPMERTDYCVGVPKKGRYTLVLNTEEGEITQAKGHIYTAKEGECDGRPYHIAYPLPPYGAAVFRFSMR